MTMRPEPYRHLESDAIFDGLEAFERKAAELRRQPRRARARPGRSARAGSVVTGPRRPEHLEPGPRRALARPLPGRPRRSRLALPMLILNAHEVEQLLDMPGCMAAMEEALVSLARGEFHLPLRPIVRPPGETHLLGLMPTYRGGERPLYALKTVAIFPDNPARGLDPHQGTVTLYDGDDRRGARGDERQPDHRDPDGGRLRASRRARSRARTRACWRWSAPATRRTRTSRRCSRPGSSRTSASPSRSRESAERLAAEWPLARAVDSNEEAVRGADVICTVTQSAEPVFEYGMARAGRAHQRRRRVLPAHARARHGDRRALGVLHRPPRVVRERGRRLRDRRSNEGAIADGHIKAELGEVLAGTAPGRDVATRRSRSSSRSASPSRTSPPPSTSPRRAGETGTGTTVEF